MNKSELTISEAAQVVSVQRCDRWSVHHRLQELNIPCACPADGTLRVEVNNATALVLARSAIRQFLTSRQEDVDWLERCWGTQVLAKADH
ncbi:MAG: Asr1405/Asl0597 family protein [Cyanobacteria bacterium P01_H01_bin.58]